ncbi:hypothetical protein C4571_03740 [Candidatus Parcubacteria bacterium]|nr:MAG: hypothetical protein C4571_03740 [Candidatus Parcubacteria bacterium]
MHTRVVVLAAGKGTRMNSHLQKVLLPFKGKPMIQRLVDAIVASGIDPRPLIIVGQQREEVQKTLGNQCEYVVQEEQLGTGHAVRCAEKALKGKADAIIVLYGDHPFVKAETVKKLYDLHKKQGCPLTMMTTEVEDFKEWRAPFYDFGRVIRDEKGMIRKVMERKDASPEELEIREVNPAFLCFDAEWLWQNLTKLRNNNAKKEYYLTDLVQIAIDEGACIASMNIDPAESIGVNTPEHLSVAKEILSPER